MGASKRKPFGKVLDPATHINYKKWNSVRNTDGPAEVRIAVTKHFKIGCPWFPNS